MEEHVRRLVCAVCVLVFAVVLAGCSKATGGGWMPSQLGVEAGKATFGFQIQCKNQKSGGSLITGQLQYKDHPLDIAIHGVARSTSSDACSDAGVPAGLFSGTYTPQPKSRGPGGEFMLLIVDGGEPGPSAGDSFAISLNGGVYDGYTNGETLGGGNIQIR